MIDAAESAVDHAHDAVMSAFERYELLNGSVEGSAGKVGVSGGLALMASLFTRGASSTAGNGNGRAAADAPVKLPPYTLQALNVEGVLLSLRNAAGGEGFIASAKLKASEETESSS